MSADSDAVAGCAGAPATEKTPPGVKAGRGRRESTQKGELPMRTIHDPLAAIDIGPQRSDMSPAVYPSAGPVAHTADTDGPNVLLTVGVTTTGQPIHVYAYEARWLAALEEAARTARVRLTMWHSDHPDGGDENG